MLRKLVLGLALMGGAALPLAGVAEAAIGDGVAASHIATQLMPVEKAQFFFGGRNFCFYPDGWHGPGFTGAATPGTMALAGAAARAGTAGMAAADTAAACGWAAAATCTWAAVAATCTWAAAVATCTWAAAVMAATAAAVTDTEPPSTGLSAGSAMRHIPRPPGNRRPIALRRGVDRASLRHHALGNLSASRPMQSAPRLQIPL